MADHPFLPKSERLYHSQPMDKVLMQNLWKVMDDLNNGLITVSDAIVTINSFPTMPTGVAKGDIIAFDGLAWGIVSVGADGEALIGDSAAGFGVSWSVVSTAPAGADTEIQYNNAGVFGADAGFTTTPAKITISKDRSGVLGALYITKGDAVQQYIVLEEDPLVPDYVYLTFKSSGGNAIAMGMEAAGGVPQKYIFTDPAAAILAWIDVTNGDVGVSNLAGVGTRNVVVDATGVLSAAALSAGDVVGPASSEDSNIVEFDGTTGKLIKDGGYNASAIHLFNYLNLY